MDKVSMFQLAQILLGGGILVFLEKMVSAFLKRRSDTSPRARSLHALTEAERNIAMIALTRDELLEDNNRFKKEIVDTRTENRDLRTEVRKLRARVEELERNVGNGSGDV